MNQIIKVNHKAYHDENDPRVKRRNYFLYSVYEVKVNEQETFQILGILGIFRLVHW
ncbi:protein of unknown function [Ruminococcaceae bacterium BL-6]|nr:protein of unknown function [Ruminococcaceae bacterium BL-6]